MDGSKHDERVPTLYGVMLWAMEGDSDFSEIQAQSQKWLADAGLFYMRTAVEIKNDTFYLVVYYNTSLDAVIAGKRFSMQDVAVPQNYLAQARARYYEQ